MVKPTIKPYVNWDNDALIGEVANEDVLTDLLRLEWRQWPDMKSGYYPPATLNMTLKNQTGTYTPANTNSPLFGNLKAGRRAWLRLAYPLDNFTGADATDLSGLLFTNDANFSWTKQNASSRAFEINTNQVRAVVGSGDDAIYTTEFLDSDPHLGFVFQRNTNAGAGVVLRFTDTNNYLAIKFGSANTILVQRAAGVNTTIRSGTALTAGVNYFIEIHLHGGAIRAFATDLDTGAFSRREILDGGGTQATQLTATKHGLWHSGVANTDRWDDFGGWRSLFYGLLQEFVPTLRPKEKTCELRLADDLVVLDTRRLYMKIAGALLSTDAIMDSVLTAAGFSVNDRELEAGQTLMSNQGASNPKPLWDTALKGLRACQDEEDGLLYQDGRGFIVLEASSHRAAGAHATSRATINDSLASAPYFDNLKLLDGSELVQNDVSVAFSNPPNQGTQQVWKLRDVPAIPTGLTRKFLAESTKYAAVDSIITPVATTDYTGNTQADGLGTDKTAQLAVTIDTTNYAGKGTMISVTNNDAGTVFVTLLKLRASSAYLQEEDTVYQATDATSQTQHGVRSHKVETRWIDYYDAIKTAADRRLARLKDTKTLLEITIPGHGHYKNLLQLVHRVIGDRITLSWTNGGPDADYFIEGIDLELQPGKLTGRWLLRGV
jgi:hypothetical protein